MDSKPEINRKMFYKIADIIETYPEKHEQEGWFQNLGIANDSNLNENIIYDGVEYKCDTNQCVAGWAIILDSKSVSFKNKELYVDNNPVYGHEIEVIAAKILGLNSDDAHQLFYTTDMEYNWPSILRLIADGKSVQDALDIAESEYWNYD